MKKQEYPKIGQQDSPKISIENLKKLLIEISTSIPEYSMIFPEHNHKKYQTVGEFCNQVSSYADEHIVKNLLNLLSHRLCNDEDEIMFGYGEIDKDGLNLNSVTMKYLVDVLNNIE